MRNQNGYALILFSFFATILGFSANFFMIRSELNANMKRAGYLSGVMDEYIYESKVLLSSYQQCTHNLASQKIGEALHVSPNTPGKTAPSLDRTDGTKILATNQRIETKMGPILVKSIRVEMVDNKVTGDPQEHLIIAADLNPDEKDHINILRSKVGKIPLKVRKDAFNQIVECYHEDSNFIEETIKQSCINSGGTFISVFDECQNTNESVDPQSVNCGFDLVRVEKIDGTYKIVCGKGV